MPVMQFAPGDPRSSALCRSDRARAICRIPPLVRLLVASVLATSLLSCCASTELATPSSAPGYFVSADASFELYPGEGLKYQASFVTKSDWPSRLYVKVDLVNPGDPRQPFALTMVPLLDGSRPNRIFFAAWSPAFRRIENDHDYAVDFFVYDDATYSHLIWAHHVTAHFYLPADFARSNGIDLVK